jgi:hypothetical protein
MVIIDCEIWQQDRSPLIKPSNREETMQVDEKEFFREITSRICGHLEIEEGLKACLGYPQRHGEFLGHGQVFLFGFCIDIDNRCFQFRDVWPDGYRQWRRFHFSGGPPPPQQHLGTVLIRYSHIVLLSQHPAEHPPRTAEFLPGGRVIVLGAHGAQKAQGERHLKVPSL